MSYIFVLHQTTTPVGREIKQKYCLISSFYIKPQHSTRYTLNTVHCLISSFYIKPQLFSGSCCSLPIVLYLRSTSNHNSASMVSRSAGIVLYLRSTSNHNFLFVYFTFLELSYIFVLHQTTTNRSRLLIMTILSYIFVLHQTTTHLCLHV